MSANSHQKPDHKTVLRSFAAAMRSRKWITAKDSEFEAALEQSLQSTDNCDCLLALLSSPCFKLCEPARRVLQQATRRGITLRLAWPRAWSGSVNEWIGPRVYFSASRNFSPGQQYFGLVCSQIGRHGSKQPNWPALVDAALKFSHRDQLRPLIVANTSLAEATKHFSDRAQLNSLIVELDARRTLAEWLNEKLGELEAASNSDSLDALADSLASRLAVSPSLDAPLEPAIAKLPIQDRIAISLADRVFAIHVRRGGTVSQLLHTRLADRRFAAGSVFVASLLGPSTSPPELEQWLDRGAVGWLLPEPVKPLARAITRCRSINASPHVQSLVLPLARLFKQQLGSQDDWPFLAHCTRGNAGPLPEESIEHYIDRVWSRGAVPECNAYETLLQILEQQRVAGNTRMTRSDSRCVSFSAVPLAELLSRRQFRSHLGRWDWEPYGVLVRRDALQSLGARPVIYGDEADFKSLDASDRDYFQPRGTKNARNPQDWSSECEWRLRGDLDFCDLPPDSILIFTHTQSQAQQIARRFPWPVLWIGDAKKYQERAVSKAIEESKS